MAVSSMGFFMKRGDEVVTLYVIMQRGQCQGKKVSTVAGVSLLGKHVQESACGNLQWGEHVP